MDRICEKTCVGGFEFCWDCDRTRDRAREISYNERREKKELENEWEIEDETNTIP